MRLHLAWYGMSAIFFIVFLVYGAWAFSTFHDCSTETDRDFLSGLTFYFFAICVASGVLGVLQHSKDRAYNKMKLGMM